MPERSTIYEVARRSGVSTATVSRVMADGTGFSAATRQRVLAAAAELGWVPSGPARGLARRRSGIVGVVFPDFGAESDDTGNRGNENRGEGNNGNASSAGHGNSAGHASSAGHGNSAGHGESDAASMSPLYADEIIRGAERAAAAQGHALLIAAGRSTGGRELVRSIAGKVDGLVVLAGSLPAADLALLAGTVPVVLLASRPAGASRLDRVSADNRGGTRLLVTHLIDQHGYRDLVFVGGPPRSPDSLERFAEFTAVLREAGLPAPARPAATGHFTDAGGAAAARRLLTREPRPEAIVFGNDEMAIGALGVLRQARIPVPGGIAVTGFDDIAAARYLSPALTTVRQPMRALGAQAVHALLDRIERPGGKRADVRLATQLIVRRSCGCRAPDARPRSSDKEGRSA